MRKKSIIYLHLLFVSSRFVQVIHKDKTKMARNQLDVDKLKQLHERLPYGSLVKIAYEVGTNPTTVHRIFKGQPSKYRDKVITVACGMAAEISNTTEDLEGEIDKTLKACKKY